MANANKDNQEAERDELIVLVDLAREGKDGALDQLLGRIRPTVRRLAQRSLEKNQQLANRVDASDITQTTLIDVVRAFQRFLGRTDNEFAAWLKTAVERNVVDEVRRHSALGRDVFRERPLADACQSGVQPGAELPALQPTPSQGAARNEEASLLRDALSQLPEELREIVRLKDIEGLPMSEIAQRLGYNTDRTAYRRYNDALQALGELLPDVG